MTTTMRITGLRRQAQARRAVTTTALALMVMAVFCASLVWGEVIYSPAQVWQVLSGEQVAGASYAVGTLRLPRAVLGLVAGIAFGAAGVVLDRKSVV